MPQDRTQDDKPSVRPPAQKTDDAAFLTEEFDIPEPRAAELVAEEGQEADAVAEQVRTRRREGDPLENVPTPDPPDAERPSGNEEVMQKQVIHKDNERPG